MDKVQEESGGAGEGAGMLKTKEVENSLENVEDKLENLKESLNNNDNQ